MIGVGRLEVRLVAELAPPRCQNRVSSAGFDPTGRSPWALGCVLPRAFDLLDVQHQAGDVVARTALFGSLDDRLGRFLRAPVFRQ